MKELPTCRGAHCASVSANHIHLILIIGDEHGRAIENGHGRVIGDEKGRAMRAPTISTVINHF